jgi:hypothetical protein
MPTEATTWGIARQVGFSGFFNSIITYQLAGSTGIMISMTGSLIFFLLFEHLEHLVLESRFQVRRIEAGCHLKTAVGTETTIRHHGVKVGVKA